MLLTGNKAAAHTKICSCKSRLSDFDNKETKLFSIFVLIPIFQQIREAIPVTSSQNLCPVPVTSSQNRCSVAVVTSSQNRCSVPVTSSQDLGPVPSSDAFAQVSAEKVLRTHATDENSEPNKNVCSDFRNLATYSLIL